MEAPNFSPYLRFIQRTGSTRHPRGLFASDMVLKRMGLTSTSTVLDVGCGAGFTTAHIAKNYGCLVTGVDISTDVLERAKNLHQDEIYYEHMNFVLADANKLPFNDACFDAVVCESVLFFIADKESAIKEMARVVKPQGFLALNELCISDEGQHNIKDYFLRSEFGGFIVTPAAIMRNLPHTEWNIILRDEEPFSLKNQFKTDMMGLLSVKGVLQFFEVAHQAFTDADTRSDLMHMIKFALDMPKGTLKQLNSLVALAQKKPPKAA